MGEKMEIGVEVVGDVGNGNEGRERGERGGRRTGKRGDENKERGNEKIRKAHLGVSPILVRRYADFAVPIRSLNRRSG